MSVTTPGHFKHVAVQRPVTTLCVVAVGLTLPLQTALLLAGVDLFPGKLAELVPIRHLVRPPNSRRTALRPPIQKVISAALPVRNTRYDAQLEGLGVRPRRGVAVSSETTVGEEVATRTRNEAGSSRRPSQSRRVGTLVTWVRKRSRSFSKGTRGREESPGQGSGWSGAESLVRRTTASPMCGLRVR
jgi:hypothetical protein